MVYTPIWTHNLRMCMEFAPLNKGVILTTQGQYINCRRGAQGCPLCNILINC